MRARSAWFPAAFAALSCLCAGCPREAARTPDDPVSRTLVEPVAAAVLAALVPETSGEWTREHVFPGEHALLHGRITSAAATYASGERKIALTLIDGAGNPEAYRSWLTAAATSLDTPTLAYARLAIAGEPAVRILTRYPLTAQIHVLVGGRFLVQTDSEELESEELERFLAGLPLERLKLLADEKPRKG